MNILALLFDISLFQLTMVMMAPLILACLGETLIERSGILNIGIEGMVTVGAVIGFLGTYQTGSAVLGCLLAMCAGSLLTLFLAYFVITLRSNQVIVGLSMFVLGLGLSPLIYRLAFGVRVSAPQVPTLPIYKIPLLGDIPFLGEAFFQQNALVYLAYVLVPAMAFFLFKTPLGLRIRSCGENPRAADTLGISVTRLRYGSCIVGGMFLGLGGAYLPLVITGTFTDNIVGGRGWLALMLVIFGRWVPGWSFVGAILFAYVDALQFRVSSLPDIARIIPPQFLLMLPYIFALLLIVRVVRGAEAPRALARPYDREARA
jgi:simple sugar transport system permease protein